MNFFMLFFFSIMFANSKMISGFCVPFFMQEIMGELGTPVILLSQIIKTTKGTNQFECGAQRHGLSKGLSVFLFLPPPPPTFSLFICFFSLTRGGFQRHLARQGTDPPKILIPCLPHPHQNGVGPAKWWEFPSQRVWMPLQPGFWSTNCCGKRKRELSDLFLFHISHCPSCSLPQEE